MWSHVPVPRIPLGVVPLSPFTRCLLTCLYSEEREEQRAVIWFSRARAVPACLSRPASATSSSDKRWACFTIDLVCRISALWRPSGLCGPDRRGGGGGGAGKRGGGGGGYNASAKAKGNSNARLFLAGGGDIFDPILSCTPASGLRKGEPPRPWKKSPARLGSTATSSSWGGGGVSFSTGGSEAALFCLSV